MISFTFASLLLLILCLLLLVAVFITLNYTLTKSIEQVTDENDILTDSNFDFLGMSDDEIFNFGIGLSPTTRGDFSLDGEESKKFSLIAGKSITNEKYNVSFLTKAITNTLTDERIDYQLLNNFDHRNYSETSTSTGMRNPKLFTHNNKQYVICSFRGKNLKVPSDLLGTKYAEYYTSDSHKIIFFPFDEPENIRVMIYEESNEIEKNWMPFVSEGELYVVYSIYPEHVILKVNEFGICQKAYSTFYTHSLPISFKKDGIGNGAPPIKYTFNNDEYFLGLAHTRQNGRSVFRKNLFYLFETSPPFAVKTITSEFHLSSKKYKIEFGSGILIDDGKVLISYGINDTGQSFKYISFDRLDEHLSVSQLAFVLNSPSFVINLDANVERLETSTSRIKENGFTKIERFPGINGRDPLIVEEKWNEIYPNGDVLTPLKPMLDFDGAGKIGCFLSHVLLLKKIIDEQIPIATIFEDDVLFHSRFKELAEEYFNSTPQDFELIFMGNQASITERDELIPQTPCFCLHAYVVTLRGAKKLYNNIINSERLFAIDCMTIEQMKLGKECCFKYYLWNGLRNKDATHPEIYSNKRSCRNTGIVFQDDFFESTISGD